MESELKNETFNEGSYLVHVKAPSLIIVLIFLVTFFWDKIVQFITDSTEQNKPPARSHERHENPNQKVGRGLVESLSVYERVIESQLVKVEKLKGDFKDVKGIDGIVKDIQEKLILPLVYHTKRRGKLELAGASEYLKNLLRVPKGVLFYGPPGCGKTMVAEATAKEANVRFINVKVSLLLERGYGESQKLVTALFSFAQKVAPCIIFIDELDTLLGVRGQGDHEVTAMMKTQFMTELDGFNSDNSNVVFLGATNLPLNLDPAIRRRLPLKLKFPLPSASQRETILRQFIQTESHGLKMVPCQKQDDCFARLIKNTEGFTPCDLKELCQLAMERVLSEKRHLLYNSIVKSQGSIKSNQFQNLGPVTCLDFNYAKREVMAGKLKQKNQTRQVTKRKLWKRK